MKKLLSLLFTFVIAFSMAMPVFAAATGGQETTTTTKTKKTHKAKTKKTKTTATTS